MSTAATKPGSLAPSPEQEELRATVRNFLDRRAPVELSLRLAEDPIGFDLNVWRELSIDLGILGIRIPADLGGAGLSFVEQAAVLEESGRVLLSAPLLATAVLATELLLETGEAGLESLASIAAGRLTASAAVTGRMEVVAHQSHAGWSLTGVAEPVVHGAAAQVLIVPARTEAGVSLYSVRSDAAGHNVRPLHSLDLTRRTSRHSFNATPAQLLLGAEHTPAALDRVRDLAAVALSAELSGVARSALELSIAHARDRYQFGRPIGSFQAVKHRCVDMLVTADSIRTAAIYAAWSASHSSPHLAVEASLAFSIAADGAPEVCGGAIQVHGGIGMTWEHPVHLYYRRAVAAQLLLGPVSEHREKLARRLWFS